MLKIRDAGKDAKGRMTVESVAAASLLAKHEIAAAFSIHLSSWPCYRPLAQILFLLGASNDVVLETRGGSLATQDVLVKLLGRLPLLPSDRLGTCSPTVGVFPTIIPSSPATRMNLKNFEFCQFLAVLEASDDGSRGVSTGGLWTSWVSDGHPLEIFNINIVNNGSDIVCMLSTITGCIIWYWSPFPVDIFIQTISRRQLENHTFNN